MAVDFPRLVSLACHDLRTPLATMQGFAKTLLRRDDLDETTARWLGMIETAGDELVALIELLSVAARIEAGRYDPVVREADSLDLARAGFPAATGTGAAVVVDPDAVERSLAALAECARRHGGVDVTVTVDGARIGIEPVAPNVAPIVLGEELEGPRRRGRRPRRAGARRCGRAGRRARRRHAAGRVGAPRSRSIAHTPSAGPAARNAQAPRQPAASSR